MKQTKMGRVLATLFLGVMFGIYRHFDQMRSLARGREVFLAEQGHRFDVFAGYHSVGTMMIAGVILAGLAVGIYELIAAAISKAIPPTEVEE